MLWTYFSLLFISPSYPVCNLCCQKRYKIILICLPVGGIWWVEHLCVLLLNAVGVQKKSWGWVWWLGMCFLLAWHFLALLCSAPLYRLSRAWGLALAPGLGGSRLVWLCGLTGSVVSAGLGLGLGLLWLTNSQRHLLNALTGNVQNEDWILSSAGRQLEDWSSAQSHANVNCEHILLLLPIVLFIHLDCFGLSCWVLEILDVEISVFSQM